MHQHTRQPVQHARQGTMAPAVGMAILVVGACLALVFDRLWIDAAQVELSAAAEAAALAAASRLADDDLLRSNVDTAARMQDVRDVAGQVAGQNRVAGRPVQLRTGPGEDVRMGRVVASPTGLPVFLETDHAPWSVVVTAQALRSRGNPVALFLTGLTGQPAGDAAARAEASVDNRISGVRPFVGASVPALPIAILKDDPSGQHQETWVRQIVNGGGGDRFAIDSTTGDVVESPDGIPEIVLLTANHDETPDRGNVQVVDLGTGLYESRVAAQIHDGWTVDDLQGLNGEMRFDGGPWDCPSSARLAGDTATALAALTGEPKVCLLYDQIEPLPGSLQNDLGHVRLCELVAGRVMRITSAGNGRIEIVLQPAVVTTRTALLTAPGAPWPGDPHEQSSGNPYIYKLHRTQ